MVAGVRFFQNAHSLNQLILGAIYALIIYYLFFEILEIELSNKNQLVYICQKGNYLVIYSLIALSAELLLISIIPIRQLNPDIELYLNTKFPNNPDFLELDSYSKSASMFGNAVIFFFCYIDYVYIFKSNEVEFLDNNFNEEGNRYNNDLKNENIIIKICISLFIMMIIYNKILASKIEERINVFYFLIEMKDEVYLGFLSFFGTKYLYDLLSLNNTISSKIFYKVNYNPLVVRENYETIHDDESKNINERLV